MTASEERAALLVDFGCAVLEAWNANPVWFSELPGDMKRFVAEYLEDNGAGG